VTRKNDTSPATAHAAPRRSWAAPRLRRLATSAAAFNPSGTTTDTEGFLS
jgi:hypothetical protein